MNILNRNNLKNYHYPSNLHLIFDLIEDNGYEVWLVGGCVRDILLGISPKDFDITTDLLPDQIKEVFKNFRIVETGIKHGTVTLVLEDGSYEITTFRKDGQYSDNRHPDSVEFTLNLKDDLSRRDFSVNALAYNILTEELIDLHGGLEALSRHLIQCVGKDEDRFQEDALRMLRAIRFCCQLDFHMFEAMEDRIFENRKLIKNVSAERIKSELDKIMLSEATEGMDLLQKTGLLEEILPEFIPTINCDQNNPNHIHTVWRHTLIALNYAPADLIVRYSVLFHDIGKPDCLSVDEENGSYHFYKHPLRSKELADQIMTRLKFDNDSKERILKLVEYHDYDIALTKPSIKRFINKGINFEDWWHVKTSDVVGQNPKVFQKKMDKLVELKKLYLEIKNYKEPFSAKDLAIDGNDIMKIANLQPSKEVGDILNFLLKEVIEYPRVNTKELLTELVYNYIDTNRLT